MFESVKEKASKLGLSPEMLQGGIDRLLIPGKTAAGDPISPRVTVSEGRIALAGTWSSEDQIAKRLAALCSIEKAPLALSASLWGEFTPDPVQVEAIDTVAESTVSILTGGPGTGKTTIIKKALQVFSDGGLVTRLAAPTGKAALRLAEQSGAEASTIHRLLGYTGDGWIFHSGNCLECSALIVDETSMVSVDLLSGLLDAVRPGTRVLLVGDVDQLPSIQAGRALFDLIAGGEIPVTKLTKIFRQAAESRIPHVAQDLQRGAAPRDLHAVGTDVRFIERRTEAEVVDMAVKAVTAGIPQQKGIKTEDIQVLAPQNKGDCGLPVLNCALQSAINPGDGVGDIAIGQNYTARKGDRVMQTHNNYELGVLNGEQGYVLVTDLNGVDMAEYPEAMTTARALAARQAELDNACRVDWDGEENNDGDSAGTAPTVETKGGKIVLLIEVLPDRCQVGYTAKEVRELILGYAISIHKSQGSQFPAVVLVTHDSHWFMNTRQLVYTAITRAEKYLLILGNERTLAKAAKNTRGADRRTQLQKFVREAFAEQAGKGAPESSLAGLSDEQPE